jgi:ectoine hydroxylase-related dioxygenase (phytanoyl-CoA dioxygenase family)
MKTLDFPPETLPWVDREDFGEELHRRFAKRLLSFEEGELACQWHERGFVILRQAVEPGLIDRMLADYETAWKEKPACKILMEGEGVILLEHARDRREFGHHHYRLMDFHNLSEACAAIMMHPRILRFLRILFEDIPAGMQTLFFEYGSEQGAHQDFPYVQSGVLSHLAAAWVACEEVDEENGPVFYYPGSHRIPKFRFSGEKLTYDGKDPGLPARFAEYLADQCQEMGFEKKILTARKGDVLVWHAALAHGGAPAKDRARTRKSLVSHYTSAGAYPRDRRFPHLLPKAVRLNGGLYYAWQHPGHRERFYRLRRSFHEKLKNWIRGAAS